jgi:hypothetical protein
MHEQTVFVVSQLISIPDSGTQAVIGGGVTAFLSKKMYAMGRHPFYITCVDFGMFNILTESPPKRGKKMSFFQLF